MIIRIAPEAEEELEAAFNYYEDRRVGLGHDFLDNYQHVARSIAEVPMRCPVDTSDARARRCRFDRFPFSVVYQVFEDYCAVVAVVHAARRPGYWRERLG